MHEFFMLLAICGLVYGAYALLLGISVILPSQREEIERKSDEIRMEAAGVGARGIVFRLGRPLYWLVALPFASVGAALFVAFLMVLPALVFK
jgi:hypothetical protein